MTEKTLGQIAYEAFHLFKTNREFEMQNWEEAAKAVAREVEDRRKMPSIREKILSGEPFTGEEFKEECLKMQNSEGIYFEFEDNEKWKCIANWRFDGLKIGQRYRMRIQKEEKWPQLVPWDAGDLMRIRRKAFRMAGWDDGNWKFIIGFSCGKYLLLQGSDSLPTFEDLFKYWQCSDDLMNWKPCGKLNTTENERKTYVTTRSN